jgi:hypothetical protein
MKTPIRPPPPPRPPRPDSPSAADREAQRLIEDAWYRHERETLRSHRRPSVRTLFEVRARVTLVWALVSLALGAGAYILVRALIGM